MTRLGAVVEAAGDTAGFVPFRGLWGAAGLLADTLPLDRPPTYPRAVRQVGHWLRLVLWDRALTNPERSAFLVIGRTPWVAAGVAAAGAAALAPRSPVWQRRLLVALGAAVVFRGRRILDDLALQRRLHDLAPGALVIADLVAEEPRTALPWIREMLATLDANRHDVTLVAILPGARRDAARQRIYTGTLGFDVVGQAGPSSLTILVRRPPWR